MANRKTSTTSRTILTWIWWPEVGMWLIYKTNSTNYKYFQSVKPQHWTSKMQFRAVSGLGQWCFELTLHRRCTSVRFSIQHPCTMGRPSRADVREAWIIQLSRTPARDGRSRVRGRRLVGRSCQISHTIQVRRFIHLEDVHSKQWVALNASSLSAYLVDALDKSTKYTCSLSTSAANGRDFMVSTEKAQCKYCWVIVYTVALSNVRCWQWIMVRVRLSQVSL